MSSSERIKKVNKSFYNFLSDYVSSYNRSAYYWGKFPEKHKGIDLNEKISDQILVDFIKKLMTYDPKQRHTAALALTHPFLNHS